MPWPCRLVEHYSTRIGDMWFVDRSKSSEGAQAFFEAQLSPDYHANHKSSRLPLVVQTPGGPWCVDQRSTGGGDGWPVTGEAPLITAHPSINIVGHYHGWLQHGVLTDDIEGRTFNEGDPA